MLEIFILIKFTKSLAETCREKNRSTGWAALGPIMWFGGEVTGFVIALSTRRHVSDDFDLGSYGIALLGAIVGAVVAYAIVKSLPEVPRDTGLPQARVL